MSTTSLRQDPPAILDNDRFYILVRLAMLVLILVIGIQLTTLALWPPLLAGSPAGSAWWAYALFALVTALALAKPRLQSLLRWSFVGDLAFLTMLTIFIGGGQQAIVAQIFYPFFLLPALRGALRRRPSASLASGVLAATFYSSALVITYNRAGLGLSALTLLGLLINGLVLAMAPMLVNLLAERWSTTKWSMVEDARREAAGALEGAEAYRDRMRALYEVAYALGSTSNYQTVLNTALEESVRLVGASTSMVLLSTGEPDEIYVAAGRGLREVDLNQRVRIGEGCLGQTLRSGEPRLINQVQQEPELQAIGAMRRSQSALCVPLTAGRSTYGVILVGSEQEHVFGEEQLGIVAALANYAIIAMRNAQLIQELREERTKLISREEEVRQQLNRDLHDGPAQALAALTMNIEFIRRLLERDPERVPAELEKMRDLALRTTKQVRTMLFELRPLTLESQGLVQTLSEYLERFKDQATQVIFEADGVDVRLGSKREGTVFNIIQESVNNAIKHAQAQHIWVRLRVEQGNLMATVQDDGAGFDLKATRKNYTQRGSFGLLNIEERARLAGGSAELFSAPGQGTTVRVLVPVDEEI